MQKSHTVRTSLPVLSQTSSFVALNNFFVVLVQKERLPDEQEAF
jgi:hypothetical protein